MPSGFRCSTGFFLRHFAPAPGSSEGWQLNLGSHNDNFRHVWQDLFKTDPIKAWQPLFPVDTGHRALDHGFLDEVFRTTFGFDDFGFFGLLVELENLRANIFATAAADALIFIDENSSCHWHLLFSPAQDL
jgi:hypothetical protein